MTAGTADRGSPSLHSSPSGGGPRGSHTAPGPAFDVWRGLPRGRDSGVGPVMESWSQGAGAGAGAVGQDRRKMQDASKTPEHPIGPTPCLLHSADLLQAAPAPLADLLGPCGGARMGAPTSAPGGPRGAHQLAASSQLACQLSLVRGTDNHPAVASARVANKTPTRVSVFRPSSRESLRGCRAGTRESLAGVKSAGSVFLSLSSRRRT